MKILIVEDNPKIRENIIKFLKISWYLAEWALHWEEALNKIAFTDYDVIILDINMPIMDWKKFLSIFREKWYWTPVLALTSNSMLDDKLDMFNLWVDDYLTKPFELKELDARLKALWKRKTQSIEDTIVIWDITISLSKHKVFKNWEEITLWNKEYLIIEFLAINKWFPKSKNQLLEKVWWESEENLELSSTTLEAHISTIRKKIWKAFIKTIKGVGYVID